MAFDRTLPANTTKLRNLGIVIRPNWEAIELADSSFQPQAINFADRTVAAVPSNPVAIADTYITYSKTDGAGNPEYFGIDDSSNVIQFTYGGRLGSPTTNLTVNNLNFASYATTYSINNIMHTYGQFTDTGATVVAANCTIAKVTTGRYRITFSSALPTTNFVTVATPFSLMVSPVAVT